MSQEWALDDLLWLRALRSMLRLLLLVDVVKGTPSLSPNAARTYIALSMWS